MPRTVGIRVAVVVTSNTSAAIDVNVSQSDASQSGQKSLTTSQVWRGAAPNQVSGLTLDVVGISDCSASSIAS